MTALSSGFPHLTEYLKNIFDAEHRVKVRVSWSDQVRSLNL